MKQSFDGLFESCQEDLSDLIMEAVKQKETVEQTAVISGWLDQYDNTNLIDKVLAKVIHNLIDVVLSYLGFQFAVAGKTFSSEDVGAVVIQALDHIKEEIEAALESAAKDVA
jgi:hypothetical protein